MAIQQMTRATVKMLRDEVEQELAELATGHGVAVTVGSARFTGTSVTFQVEIAVKGDNGLARTREAEEFKLYAETFGLKPEWLGQSFKDVRGVYKIKGLNTRAPKYPVLAENIATGTMYKFPTDTVRRHFGAA